MRDSYPTVNLEGTGYVHDGRPAFGRQFLRAMSFHAPEGLAAVADESGAYHIGLDGEPSYPNRHVEAYGFYEGLATVRDEGGFFHVHPDGEPAHAERFLWAGNFQEGRCTVLGEDGFFHITPRGTAAYAARYSYAGDFVHGIAAVRAGDRARHIRPDGAPLHDRSFVDAGVFHKGAAVVHDQRGAFHVGVDGRPLHDHRFHAAEPFYNGIALCVRTDGRRVRLHENGFLTHLPEAAPAVRVREIEHHVAEGGRAVLLLRHAERDPVRSGWGDELLLTPRGVEQARGLGKALAGASPSTIWSSPVERCIETARNFADGAGTSASPFVTRLLGAPGPFHDPAGGPGVDPDTFADFATRYLATGRASGMRPLEVACQRLLTEMLEQTGTELSVLVSHDLFVAGLARFLGLKYPTRDDWADFLEGVCVLESPAGTVKWRRFHGLREIDAC